MNTYTVATCGYTYSSLCSQHTNSGGITFIIKKCFSLCFMLLWKLEVATWIASWRLTFTSRTRLNAVTGMQHEKGKWEKRFERIAAAARCGFTLKWFTSESRGNFQQAALTNRRSIRCSDGSPDSRDRRLWEVDVTKCCCSTLGARHQRFLG